MNFTDEEYNTQIKGLANRDIESMGYEKGIELVKTSKDFSICKVIEELEEAEDLKGLENIWVALTSLALDTLVDLQIQEIENEL